ncbi:MAG: 2Fe-2S iron-sulfur cluster binding domain-containing protein [Gemmatimonadetes bacterium]|nr:2Fe-2S iron-sulfur cluster binding domain-containing protein [Gemmatimonadota bacterium]
MAMANESNETVNVTINGVAAAVPRGARIIEAAEQLGIGIAHYCYHPGLSAPAMCRMCLVEVEGAPKLAPACVTPVAEGQVINTESERARAARTGTLEFYLLNHPLDCPICDKSGECKLQDFTHAEGRPHGRSVEPKRVLGLDDFGGDILYQGNRCIMCTRCVRFMREIAGADLLGVVQRGHRSAIDTFFETGLEGSLWAGNIVDICPVGALLSKDFLHKARVWDLDNTPSVCPNCAQGCNVRLDTRDNLVVRIRPRLNPAVNSYWMCDYGRHQYEWLNQPDRVQTPMQRGAEGELVPVGWQEVLPALLARLQQRHGPLVVLGSPMLGNEDNGLLARLAGRLGGGTLRYRSAQAEAEVPCPGFPALARRRELTANGRGLELLGFQRTGTMAGEGGLTDLAGATVIVLGDALEDQPADFAAGVELLVVLGQRPTAAARSAHYLLPVCTCAEQEGTFPNVHGLVQRFWPALQPPPLARPAWQVLSVLLAGLDDGAPVNSAGGAFLRLGELYPEYAGLSYEQLGSRGALINEPVVRPAGKGA